MKKAFSLIFAILFLLLIMTLGLLSLNILSLGAKETQDKYLQDQAELFAQGAEEYAILAIREHNYSANCLDSVVINYPVWEATTNGECNQATSGCQFRAQIDIQYIALKDTKSDIYTNCTTNFISSNVGDANKITAVVLNTTVKSNLALFGGEQVIYTHKTTQIP